MTDPDHDLESALAGLRPRPPGPERASSCSQACGSPSCAWYVPSTSGTATALFPPLPALPLLTADRLGVRARLAEFFVAGREELRESRPRRAGSMTQGTIVSGTQRAAPRPRGTSLST